MAEFGALGQHSIDNSMEASRAMAWLENVATSRVGIATTMQDQISHHVVSGRWRGLTCIYLLPAN